MSKRKRDPSFQPSEKVLLVELVEKHYLIVESKKTDAVSVREKNDEWRKISMEFNATSGLNTRDWQVLKICWENLKKKAKDLITKANQSFLATGGGPPKSFPVDPVMERVTNLIKPTVTGFTNEFDGDGTLVLVSGSTADSEVQPTYYITYNINSQKLEQEDIYSEIVLHSNERHESPEKQVELVDRPIDNSKDWSNHSPAMLRAPIRDILRTGNQMEQNSITENVEPVPSCSNVQSSYEATPVRIQTQSVSRRRPVLNQSQTLTQQLVDSLLSASQQAKEQHEAQMRILKLQEERESELLKQERLRTEQEQLRILILKEELKKF